MDVIHLEKNINMFIDRTLLEPLIGAALADVPLNELRFSDMYGQELCQALARKWDVSVDSVLLGAGSSQLIDIFLRLYQPQPMNLAWPHYGIYYRLAEYHGFPVRVLPVHPFGEARFGPVPGDGLSPILCLANPNSMFGTQFTERELLDICESFPGRILIDEVYGEYVSFSMIPYVRSYPNLTVLRSFSKAWGLATFRIGYAIHGERDTASLRQNWALPWGVSPLSARIALEVLANPAYMQSSLAEMAACRRYLIAGLDRVPWLQTSRSCISAVYCESSCAGSCVDHLKAKGILVHAANYKAAFQNSPNGFRITVGATEAVEALLEALSDSEQPPRLSVGSKTHA